MNTSYIAGLLENLGGFYIKLIRKKTLCVQYFIRVKHADQQKILVLREALFILRKKYGIWSSEYDADDTKTFSISSEVSNMAKFVSFLEKNTLIKSANIPHHLKKTLEENIDRKNDTKNGKKNKKRR